MQTNLVIVAGYKDTNATESVKTELIKYFGERMIAQENVGHPSLILKEEPSENDKTEMTNIVLNKLNLNDTGIYVIPQSDSKLNIETSTIVELCIK